MKKLFEEFSPVSSKAWKQKIQVDLKGADYNDSLVWTSPEGIDVKPFYHQDQFENKFDKVPGHPQNWKVVQSVYIGDTAITHRLIHEALEKGAEAIELKVDSAFNIREVFDELPLEDIPLYFRLGFLDKDFIPKLISQLEKYKAKVYLNFDPLGQLASTGNWFKDKDSDHKTVEQLLNSYPGCNILGVDTGIYQNAGAHMVQQLAYGLAHANEYLNHLGKTRSRMTFSISVGGNYFFEIAKIRALRKLYAVLAKAYGQPESCHVIASPSLRNKTVYEYNMNMLRTTTECMSAVLGGADAISNLAYDTVYHKSNAFGERISRNQLLILKSESYFGEVSNPVDGTYYIESLTSSLADKALSLFKEIESSGGFLNQLWEGSVQKKIDEQARAEQQRFDNEEMVLVGTNKYQNPDDRMKEQIELFPFLKKETRKTLIQPVIARRLSENLEKQRLDHE